MQSTEQQPNTSYKTRQSKKRQTTEIKDPNPSERLESKEKSLKDYDEEKKKEKIEKIKQTLLHILDHNITTIVMTIITIYALFGDDIRILATNKYGDPYFWVFNIIAMFAFSLEIVISSIAKDGYLFSFFFVLDIVSTLSLLLDIGWFSQILFANGESTGASSAASLARAGRASRVGTKAGRIVRIVRLIRLVKLYKHASQVLFEEALAKEEQEHGGDEAVNKENLFKRSQSLAVKHLIQGQIDQTPNVQKQMQDRENKKILKAQTSGPQNFSEGNQLAQKQDKIDNKGNDRQSINKLPPISSIGKTQTAAEADGPSKPIILDKYKNDPLLQFSGENTERKLQEKDQEDTNHKNEEEKKHYTDMESSHQRKEQRKLTSEMKKEGGAKKEEKAIPQETVVGKKLSDLTTKRVITLVLSIMFSIPIFSIETYIESTQSYNNGLWTLYVYKDNPDIMNLAFLNYVDYHDNLRAPVLHVKFEVTVPECCQTYPTGNESKKVEDYKELRNEEVTPYSIKDDSSDKVIGYAIVDDRANNNLNAILSIVRTLFVSVVLSVGAMSFSRDVEQLVVEPIENMVEKVKRIAENPLEASQMEEQEAFVFQKLKNENNQKEIRKKQLEEKMETVILEKLIIKIGALLAVGFGEAGSEIIAKNMKKGGAVDPMIPGIKIMAIFGFCDIRNFTDATEVLQTGVMVFVNEIAQITHGCVDEFCGQSNKNIGDAFLLVWKYSQDHYSKTLNGDVILKNDPAVKRFSDLSVLSFVKIMAHIAQSQKLDKYKRDARLCKRIPGYDKNGVRMGFGLHQGWAIEGAIGSEYKIDASYLSPNVNMASRLEAATKQFGTGLLISGDLQSTLTDRLKKELRQIDRVTVKGSIEPMDLYTCDVSFDNMLKHVKSDIDKYDTSSLNQIQRKKKRVIDRIKRNKRRKDIEEGTVKISHLFSQDKELFYMREIFQQEFYQKWEEGFKHYLSGNWSEAKIIFEKTLLMYEKQHNHRDGCSNTLLEVIEENKGKAPADWKGFRPLTEK